MSNNPMMMAMAQAEREAKMKADIQAETAAERAEMAAAAAKLQDALLKAKREKRSAGATSGGRAGRRIGHRRMQSKKKGFGKGGMTNAGLTDGVPAIAEIELVVAPAKAGEVEKEEEDVAPRATKNEQKQKKKKKKKKKASLKGRQHKVQSEAPASATSSMGETEGPDSVGQWDTLMDHSTGRPYYVHRKTLATSWTLPDQDGAESTVTMDGANPAFNTNPAASRRTTQLQRSFTRHLTDDDKEYFEEGT